MNGALLIINENYEGLVKDPDANVYTLNSSLDIGDDNLLINITGRLRINGDVKANIITIHKNCEKFTVTGKLYIKHMIACDTNVFVEDKVSVDYCIYVKHITSLNNINVGNVIISFDDIICRYISIGEEHNGCDNLLYAIICQGRIECESIRSKGSISAKEGIQSRGQIYAEGFISSESDIVAYSSIESGSFIDVAGRIFTGIMVGLNHPMTVTCTELKRGTICYGNLYLLKDKDEDNKLHINESANNKNNKLYENIPEGYTNETV